MRGSSAPLASRIASALERLRWLRASGASCDDWDRLHSALRWGSSARKAFNMAKRRTYTAGFKAMVVREAMRGEKTLRQVAAKHGVHPNQVSRWKREATEGLVELFERGANAEQDEHDAQVRKLRRKAEQLVLERDFLKRVWDEATGTRAGGPESADPEDGRSST